MIRLAVPFIGLWLILLVVPQAAAGQAVAAPAGTATSPGSTERARQFFEQGIAHAQAERWAEAAEAFKQARAIASRPSILFNLASVLYRLGSLVEARQLLAEYSSTASATDDKREDARQLQVLVEHDIPILSLSVDPADAEVVVDGATRPERGANRTFILDPGEHRLEVRAAGQVTQSLALTLAPAERRTQNMLLRQAPPLPKGSAQPPPAEAARSKSADTHPGPAAAVEPTSREPEDDDGGLLSSPVFWAAAVAVVGGGAATAYFLTREDETTTAAPTGGTTGIVLTAP